MAGITSTMGPIRCLDSSESSICCTRSTVARASGEPGVPWNSSTTGNRARAYLAWSYCGGRYTSPRRLTPLAGPGRVTHRMTPDPGADAVAADTMPRLPTSPPWKSAHSCPQVE